LADVLHRFRGRFSGLEGKSQFPEYRGANSILFAEAIALRQVGFLQVLSQYAEFIRRRTNIPF
jgi:hypothetical protein